MYLFKFKPEAFNCSLDTLASFLPLREIVLSLPAPNLLFLTVVVFVGVGVTAGLATGLTVGLATGLTVGLATGLATGLAVGLAVGLDTGFL